MKLATRTPPSEPTLDDVLVKQNWLSYSPQDHDTWAALYNEMSHTLRGRSLNEFFTGLSELQMASKQVVKFEELSERLRAHSGWEYVAVAGLIPTDVFFELLANKRFPSSCLIRQPEGGAYQELPDIFHDVFGHAPLLINPAISDFVQACAQAALNAHSALERTRLARLYWYTIEVGLISRQSNIQIFGAAISSSKKETMFALEDPSPNHVWFDVERVVRTPYSIYDLQETYFVIPELTVLSEMAKDKFKFLHDIKTDLPDYHLGELVSSDKIIQRGTQAYHRAKASSTTH